MRVETEILQDKEQTARKMYLLSRRYCNDLDSIFLSLDGEDPQPLSALDMQTYYDFIRLIPYRRDSEPVEVVSRPYHILRDRNKGADCKKKAICLGAWLAYQGVPFRFVATSRRPDRVLHHVFPQAKLSGEWVNLDATYSNYKLGQSKQVTAFEVL